MSLAALNFLSEFCTALAADQPYDCRYLLYRNKLNGILGDEMGLGKTVQATALIGQLHHVGKVQPTIVVAPASVLENWEREVTAWLPGAWVMKYLLRTIYMA